MSRFSISNCKTTGMTYPLSIALIGPSYAGKTKSALRLAEGTKRVSPGPIVYIDTEGGRALEFSDEHDFEHMPFEEPYGSLDYVEALDTALTYKPSCVILDSVSHEHEGAGGYMDVANDEQESGKREGQMYARPAGYRRRLLSRLLTYPVTIICCFRAKPCLDWKSVFEKKMKQPENLGYMAQGGSEFVYQMTVRCLLVPEKPLSPFKGAPVWDSDYKGEIEMMKLGPFTDVLSNRHQLCEADGEAMARWATGKRAKVQLGDRAKEIIAKMGAAGNIKELTELEASYANETFPENETEKLRTAMKKRRSQLA